jgi:cytochrome P450
MDGSTAEPIDAEWCAHAFDHLSPVLADELHDTMAYMRENHPFARSERYGGFWIATRYEDVLRIAQDWESFTSTEGITVPSGPTTIPAIPEQLDPPLHREFKRLINAWFTPAIVAKEEQAMRDVVTGLIDAFIESGSCEFMADFAKPLPGLVFFDLFLHAPPEEVAEINRLAGLASTPTTKEAIEARKTILGWISSFVDERRKEDRRDDVVDAILHAEIDGREITQTEIVGVIQLLLFGGLDTTAGALGMIMTRLALQPEIPELLRSRPELLSEAVEELVRLDGPFAFIARTATRDTEVAGQTVKKGDKVLLSWLSANRDEAEFACPAQFDLERQANRHIAFGAGPHRCAGSHLARANLRIALTELLRRLDDIRLAVDPATLEYHKGYSRAPEAVPLTFTPGAREGVATATSAG